MAATPPDDLVKAIREGRALIVCGAGVSRLATGGKAPGWADLIKNALELAAPKGGKEPAWVRACRQQLELDADTEEWLKAADTIQEKLGGHSSGRYRGFLSAGVGKLEATEPAVIDALLVLTQQGNRVSTTNYDNLLCSGLKRQPVNWRDTDSVAECLNGDHEAVLHLHGHWRDAASVVFSRNDYRRLRSAESAQFLQQLAAHNFTLVFMGCSTSGLADENVGALLDWFGTRWAGLGKKHYVLVREGDVTANWPDAVTAVAYGKDFADLPDFLATLAPARVATAVAPAALRAPFPPDPKMIGRGEQLEEIVKHILAGDRPVVVPGGPGMGKTTLALAAAHDKKVKERFGAARVFVDLQAVTSADALLRALASEIGVEITGSSADILASLAAHAAKTPTQAILDNLETPWHAEAIKTEEMLGQLAGIDGLRIVLTVRGETPRVPGGAHRLGDVERLAHDDARKLFLREAGDKFSGDTSLRVLLDTLDGHPLSIVLMAAQADGRNDLGGLVQDWNKRRATVLARGKADDRLNSVRVSLGLSLNRLRPDPKRLLGLMALLPAGLQEENIAAVLPPAAADAAAALIKARLVESRGGRLTMLAPLREIAREEKLAKEEDEALLIAHFLAVAADGDKIGTAAWPSVRERVTREAGNLDAICMLAVERIGSDADADRKPLSTALRGLSELHRFGVPAEVRSLHQALILGDDDAALRLKAECALRLGVLASDRSDHDTARARYEEAKPLYKRVGDLLGQANCTLCLGDIALARSEHDTARIRFEEAKSLYERAGHLSGHAICIFRLGDIALARSEHDTARAHYNEAKSQFERTGDLLGQANCIKSLGDIARERSDHDTARARYEEAKPLYERVGHLFGQANCIFGLGSVALRRSDHVTARACLDEAMPLFERVGSLLGQANCIKSLGDIALQRSDHNAALARFEEAKPLYQRGGDLLGQANCIKSIGTIALQRSDHDTARARYEEALVLYAKIPEPYSIGFTHLTLMRVAANADDRNRHREAARKAWASIDRQDLIAKHLIPPKKKSPRKKRGGK